MEHFKGKPTEQPTPEKKSESPNVQKSPKLPDVPTTAKRLVVWTKAEQVYEVMWDYITRQRQRLPEDQKKALHTFFDKIDTLPWHEMLEGLAGFIKQIEPNADPFETAMSSMEAELSHRLSAYTVQLDGSIQDPEKYRTVIEGMQAAENDYQEFKAFRKEYNNVRNGRNPVPKIEIL
jgi:hypothetical protein